MYSVITINALISDIVQASSAICIMLHNYNDWHMYMHANIIQATCTAVMQQYNLTTRHACTQTTFGISLSSGYIHTHTVIELHGHKNRGLSHDQLLLGSPIVKI